MNLSPEAYFSWTQCLGMSVSFARLLPVGQLWHFSLFLFCVLYAPEGNEGNQSPYFHRWLPPTSHEETNTIMSHVAVHQLLNLCSLFNNFTSEPDSRYRTERGSCFTTYKLFISILYHRALEFSILIMVRRRYFIFFKHGFVMSYQFVLVRS